MTKDSHKPVQSAQQGSWPPAVSRDRAALHTQMSVSVLYLATFPSPHTITPIAHRTSILLLCKRQIRVLAGKEFTINIHQTNDPPLSLKEKKPFTPPHPIMIQLDKQAWLDSLVTVREWYWQTIARWNRERNCTCFCFPAYTYLPQQQV